MTVLRLSRCVLRPWAPGDVQSLVRHADDRAVWRGLRDAFPHPYRVPDAEAWIAGSQGTDLALAIEVGGEAVGSIGLVPGADVGAHTAELGYWLGRAHWGRGIATEALGTFVEDAFARRPFTRLHALVFASNPASARVLERCDFVREAVMRDAVVKEGVIQDAWPTPASARSAEAEARRA